MLCSFTEGSLALCHPHPSNSPRHQQTPSPSITDPPHPRRASRRLLSTTLTLLKAIALLAMIGDSSQPVSG